MELHLVVRVFLIHLATAVNAVRLSRSENRAKLPDTPQSQPTQFKLREALQDATQCLLDCTIFEQDELATLYSWSQVVVTATITHATVVAVVDGSSTGHSTRFNTDLQGQSPPTTTNDVGTATAVVPIVNSDLKIVQTTLVYPTGALNYDSTLDWQGTLLTTYPGGSTQCLTQQMETTETFPSHPTIAASTQSIDPEDSKGWTYVVVSRIAGAGNANLQQAFPRFDPLHYCTAGGQPTPSPPAYPSVSTLLPPPPPTTTTTSSGADASGTAVFITITSTSHVIAAPTSTPRASSSALATFSATAGSDDLAPVQSRVTAPEFTRPQTNPSPTTSNHPSSSSSTIAIFMMSQVASGASSVTSISLNSSVTVSQQAASTSNVSSTTQVVALTSSTEQSTEASEEVSSVFTGVNSQVSSEISGTGSILSSQARSSDFVNPSTGSQVQTSSPVLETPQNTSANVLGPSITITSTALGVSALPSNIISASDQSQVSSTTVTAVAVSAATPEPLPITFVDGASQTEASSSAPHPTQEMGTDIPVPSTAVIGTVIGTSGVFSTSTSNNDQAQEPATTSTAPTAVSTTTGSLPSVLLIGSQRITAGGVPVTVNGAVISLPIGATSIVVDGAAKELSAASAIAPTGETSVIEIASAGGFEITTVTNSDAGTAIIRTVSGSGSDMVPITSAAVAPTTRESFAVMGGSSVLIGASSATASRVDTEGNTIGTQKTITNNFSIASVDTSSKASPVGTRMRSVSCRSVDVSKSVFYVLLILWSLIVWRRFD